MQTSKQRAVHQNAAVHNWTQCSGLVLQMAYCGTDPCAQHLGEVGRMVPRATGSSVTLVCLAFCNLRRICNMFLRFIKQFQYVHSKIFIPSYYYL